MNTAFKRSRIKSISCFGVSMPLVDFFWKQCNNVDFLGNFDRVNRSIRVTGIQTLNP
jgi:hypothetical protein